MTKVQKRFEPHHYAEHLRDSGRWRQDGGVLYYWNGNFWQALSETEADKAAYKWLVDGHRKHASPENARKATKAALLWCEKVPLPTPTTVIPCRNGYLHVRDVGFDLESPDPALGLRHSLACSFEPDAQEPALFHNLLKRILPDTDVRSRVQEYCGYTLTNDARYQVAQYWLGSGANGKGVLARTLMALHGRPEAVALDALDGFRLSSLIDASLIYCDEAPRGRINEQQIKSLIASERIQIDRKYRDPVSVCIRAKWLVLGNHLPSIADHSNGFWRRWNIIPFDVVIPENERNPELAKTIIELELSGVLRWALEGLVRLQQRGRFNPDLPGAMAKLYGDVQTQTDSVRGWLQACDISSGAALNTTKDDAYSHYRGWCITNGLAPLSSPRFWPRVRDAVSSYQERRVRQDEKQTRCCNLVLPF